MGGLRGARETGDDLGAGGTIRSWRRSASIPWRTSAGSHATRYFRGEYLTELAFPLPRFLSAVRRIARRFWYVTLRQYADEDYREKP